MYKITASDRRLETAIIEITEGEYVFSWGPGMCAKTPCEEDLRPIHPYEIRTRMKNGYLVRHDPPIIVAELRDWPEAVKVRLNEMRAA
jgi:hypothetical protein